MSYENAAPFGAMKAILDYGEVLQKLDDSNPRYLVEFNKDVVRAIHNHFSNFFGESNFCRDEKTFDNLCNAPFQSAMGQDAYSTDYLKAAKILEGFATHQVFSEGNKRLAVGATIQFLKSKGIDFEMSREGIYNFVLDISNRKFGSLDDEVEVNGIPIPVPIIKIADVIRENSVELEKSANVDKSMHYPPLGSAKNFDKNEYENASEELENEEYAR